jgi:transcriptional regulator of acetoin/glycerol metabolism
MPQLDAVLDRPVSMGRAQAELDRALQRIAELEAELRALGGPAGDRPVSDSEMKLIQVEGALVRRAMDHHKGNVSRAARTLGLSRSALYRRLDRHKIRHAETS